MWYIYRYSKYNTRLEADLRGEDIDVFVPKRYSQKRNPHTNALQSLERPLMPGYIFVSGWFGQIQELSHKYEVSIMSVHGKIVNISQPEMERFMMAIDLSNQNINLYNGNIIELRKYDEVLITEGEFKGLRGRLKKIKGKSGGLVIVPLRFEYADNYKVLPHERRQLPGSSEDKDNFELFNLNYEIQATADQIQVVKFADCTRHALDTLGNARKRVNEIMALYIKGSEVTPAQRQRMSAYVRRLAEVKMDTDTLQARHLMLLLRIYTILDYKLLQQELRSSIEKNILPKFQHRIATVCSRDKQSAQRSLDRYLEELADTISAPQLRKINLEKVGGETYRQHT